MTIKDKILNASLKLFFEKGFNAGLNDIINEAVVSKGAVYHHFVNKDDLYEKTIIHFLHRKPDYDFIKNHEEPYNERLSKIINYYFKSYTDNSVILSNLKSKANLFYLFAEYAGRDNLKLLIKNDFRCMENAFKDLFTFYEQENNTRLYISPSEMAEYCIGLIKGSIINFMLDIERGVQTHINSMVKQITEFFELMNERE